MIKDHYQFLVMGKPYLALDSRLAIMILVSSFYDYWQQFEGSLRSSKS
ncbi:MAG: hypothetical protein CM15mP83_4000 [Flavobacteriaceae bacterium]|nr:MAG: hypothetical protein CM15mP83_4000 [Flavobacteriaceae bacterium]